MRAYGLNAFPEVRGVMSIRYFSDQLPDDNCLSRPVFPHEEARHKSSASASILLVEDDVLNQMIASKLLDRLGHQVRIANNGKEALDELETHDFDLVLMDMQMPVMDGIEATRRLRSTGNTLPVLAFTANTSSDDHRLCLDAGMQDVLIKPVQMETLTRKLERFL